MFLYSAKKLKIENDEIHVTHEAISKVDFYRPIIES